MGEVRPVVDEVPQPPLQPQREVVPVGTVEVDVVRKVGLARSRLPVQPATSVDLQGTSPVSASMTGNAIIVSRKVTNKLFAKRSFMMRLVLIFLVWMTAVWLFVYPVFLILISNLKRFGT